MERRLRRSAGDEHLLYRAEIRSMLQTIRLILAASTLAVAATPAGLALTGPAFAQAAAPEGDAPKQVALTQKVIDSLLAAQPEMSVAQSKAQGGNSDKPDPKLQAKMEAIAKKYGFAGLGAYEEAADSVGIVLAGMDPDTKSYVGPIAIIKNQMIQVQADKSLPPKDKAQTLNDMKEALATAGATKPAPGNADLVAKNYDKLSDAFQGGE